MSGFQPNVRLFLLGLFLAALVAGCGPAPGDEPSGDSPQPLDVIAFGSCARQDQPQPVWDRIIAEQPDLFLFIGDNIYGDTEDMAVMREKYTQLAEKPGYQRLQQVCPVLATWDDHDYGVNDGGVEYPAKVASQQEFLRFFREPEDSPRRREGIYDARLFGPEGKRVQVILLDTRYFRSPLQPWPEGERKTRGPYRPSDDPDATVLGAAQWEWLETQLRQTAQLRIIASSIQVIPEEHGWEGWANFPRERERLFALIRDIGANGVVFISGDRHHGEISRLAADEARGIGYPLYDITSSGLNQSSTGEVDEPNRHRVSPAAARGTNYGILAVDWSQDDPALRLQVHDGEGKVLFEEKTLLSTLTW